jgi:hypothetical protein
MSSRTLPPEGQPPQNSLERADPAYERDDGPVSDSMLGYIRQTVPQDGFLPTPSLFCDVER